ncbi:MAG: neutral/alkaline non-lysosomal ceramidase N-terminal domain-containing protein [Planctomycetaceae bacterium]|jgi:putative membrane-bound dehydrogenase-like protein|nr:neutral/alkaline non-lysosomal ceramidase N-terminal domain-containing protein [Planctomycetaceae bacterium]
MFRLSFSALLIAAFLLPEILCADEQPLVPIGAAKVDITPPYPIRLTGYGSRPVEAEGVEQKLQARALAIGSDDDGPTVIVTVELLGITPELRSAALARINMQYAVSNDKFVLCATHTHNGPCVNGVCPLILGDTIREPEQERIDDYTTRLVDLITSAANQALKSRQPGRLFHAEGEVGFAINRRTIKDGTWTGFGVNPNGPVDHRLPILVAKDKSGKPLAIWSNYACHCTTLGPSFNKICGDWAGYASANLESDYESAIALVSIGAGADANPEPRGSDDQLSYAQKHGEAFRKEVNRLLTSELKPLSSEIDATFKTVKLPFKNARTIEEWQAYAKQPGQRGVYGRYFLDKLKQNGALPTTLDYPISSLTFGDDLAMIFLGGEVVCDYSLTMYKKFAGDRLWVTAYANDVPCYIPSRRILDEQGYEADYSMIYYRQPNQLSPAVEEIILDTVQSILPPKFYTAELQQNFPPPKSPAEAVNSFQLPPGLKLKLVAAEPLVMDPVAFDWGMDGSLWVVEMADYPSGLDGEGKPGGKVKVLRDTDGDGKYDTSTVFLDNLPFPTGVKVYQDQILITAAPNILSARDLNGDDVADETNILYAGFGEGNQQHRVNGLRWGLDNWLYVGNGDSGGEIKSNKTGESVNVRRRDLRIRPNTGELEAISGNTQFGINRDNYGNWFGGNNSNPMWHYVLDQRYLLRNPYVVFPDAKVMVSDQPGAAAVYPISRTLGRFNDFDRTNRFTSACSPIIYRDSDLGEQYAGNSFVCEPVHNLVHREVMRREGVTFRSSRAPEEQKSEFLASTDNWSRPAMIRTAPDGTLWVADMYRFVIEHPKWIPEHQERQLNVRAGSDKGRIYRIVPEDGPRPIPNLDKLSQTEVVDLLESTNGTLRDMASQWLIWNGDAKIILPKLKSLLLKSSNTLARIHALSVLDSHSTKSLTPGDLEQVLKSSDPLVVSHAVSVSEKFVNDHPQLGKLWLSLIEFDDPQLLMQLAYSLGEWESLLAGPALGRLLVKAQGDPYLTAAAISSLNEINLSSATKTILETEAAQNLAIVTPLLKTALGLKQSQPATKILLANASLNNLGHWSQLLASVGNQRNMLESIAGEDEALQSAIDDINQRALDLAFDDSADLDQRAIAIAYLGNSLGVDQRTIERLAELIQPGSPLPLQTAALEILSHRADETVYEKLLADWESLTPTLKTTLLSKLMQRDTGLKLLLTAVKNNTVAATEISPANQQRFLQHADESFRKQAENVFGQSTSRAEVLTSLKGALTIYGDAEAGRPLFKKHCSQCHQINKEGFEVGPDLTAITNRSPAALFVSILDPNAAVEDKFLQYVAVTAAGFTHTGRLVSESANSIVLEAAEKKRAEVLYADLEILRSTGKSLMPEGLEKELNERQLADLIAYVSELGPDAKTFPGLSPQRIKQNSSRIALSASAAYLFGPSISYSGKYDNLETWSRPEDRAVWKLEVTEPGKYQILIDYSCDPVHAGNRFRITIDRENLDQQVNETSSWDEFEIHELGTVSLDAGPTRLMLQSLGPVHRDSLFKLRSVSLVKVE